MIQLIPAIWLLGVLTVLSRTFIGIMAARRLVRRCQAVVSGPLADAAEQVRETLSLTFGVEVREGPPGTAVVVPMTFGLLRPVVLLPFGAAEWPAERLRVVMLHEIAHIKRRDWLTTMLAEVACALYWFHPLVWLAAHRLRTESEQACDDLVLTSGIQAVDYADHLLEVVRGLTGRGGSMPAVVTMAQERDLTGRLKTILAENRDRRTVGRRGTAFTALTAACLLVPLAAMRPMPATGSTRSTNVSLRYPQTGVKPAVKDGYTRMGRWQRTLLNAPASPWKATLPNGVRVCLTELWALNGPDSDKFWTPDGTVLMAAGGNGTTPYYGRFHSRVYNIDVALSFSSDALRREARVSFGRRGDHPGDGTDLAGFDRNGGFLNGRRIINTGFQRMLPPSQKKIDLVVSIATGPETTLISASPLHGAIRRLQTGEVVRVSAAAIHSKADGIGDVASFSLTLPSRFVRDESEYKISLIGQNGQPLNVPRVSQSYPVFNRTSAAVAYSFSTAKLPISRVKELRLTYRSSQTAVFRNVSLRPATRAPSTTIIPSFGSLAVSETAPPTSARLTDVSVLPDGTQVRLVAVVPKPAGGRPIRPMWSPNGSPVNWTGRLKNQGFVESQIVDTGSQIAERKDLQFWLLTTPRVRYTSGQVRLVPRSPSRADVTIPVTTGSYTTLIGGSIQNGAVRRLPTGEVVRLSKVVEHPPANNPVGRRLGPVAQVTLNLPARYARDYSSYWLMGVGSDGKLLNGPYPSVTDVAKPGQREKSVVFSFRSTQLKRMGVKGFRFMYRPVHDLVFRDVALRPDGPSVGQSVSQASRIPAAPSGDSNTVPAVVNAVGGLAQVAKGVSLQLMGVSDLPSDNQRWWRSDGTRFVYEPEQYHVSFKPPPQIKRLHWWPVFLFRLMQPKQAVTVDIDPWWHSRMTSEPKMVRATFCCTDLDNGITLSGNLGNVIEGPNSFAVRLWVAAGPWRREQVRITSAQGTFSVGGLHKGWIGSYALRRLSATASQVILTASPQNESAEIRLVAIHSQGRQYIPVPSPTSFGGYHVKTPYTVALPPSIINELIVETRPYTAVDFKGIARQPNTARQPPVARQASLAAPVQTVQSWSPTLGGGVSQLRDALSPDPAVRARASQERIDDALSLRQHLSGWALKHAPLIRQMLQATPNDLAALIRAYPKERIPGRYPGDLRLQEPGHRNDLVFTGLSTPLTLSHLKHSHGALVQGIREDFAKYRDFRLSRSVNTGRSWVTLCASGRVTETTLVDQKVGRGKPILMTRVESRDIALPYEFLFPQSVF